MDQRVFAFEGELLQRWGRPSPFQELLGSGHTIFLPSIHNWSESGSPAACHWVTNIIMGRPRVDKLMWSQGPAAVAAAAGCKSSGNMGTVRQASRQAGRQGLRMRRQRLKLPRSGGPARLEGHHATLGPTASAGPRPAPTQCSTPDAAASRPATCLHTSPSSQTPHQMV